MMRSHYCGHINESLIDQQITLCGWVHRRRDHGGLIFLDLRDREGRVQVVFHPENNASFAIAETVRHEYVLQIKGMVRHRPAGTLNEKLKSGKVEVDVSEVSILNTAEPVPFRIDEYSEINEETRLRYRYLDLRREEMLSRLRFRAHLNQKIRNYLSQHGFFDIETPLLTKSTPEGARDYLVPSRIYPGSFYALPQSPQIFKQLLMVGGIDRYYQIARCFRDEDLRADRQPEFTQLDMEMSFIEEVELQCLVENMIRELFADLLDVVLPNSFPHMTYHEAIRRFGVDRPDLRIPLEFVDIADLVKEVTFKVFAEPANDKESRVVALKVPKGTALSRKEIDDYTHLVCTVGAKGLAYIKVNNLNAGIEGLQSPLLKFLPEETVWAILKRVDATTGDIIFFGADKAKVVNDTLSTLRLRLGHDLKLIEEGWRFVWIVDFPLFEWDEKAVRWQSVHHPFTAPKTNDPVQILADPGTQLARAYDLVLNGSELGGGSIRIHQADMQRTIFQVLGMDEKESETKFGHLLTAFRYGCPPHGGLAFGLDRIIMLMTRSSSIREVMAFPKTQTAHCPLTSAPDEVSEGQLKELGLTTPSKRS